MPLSYSPVVHPVKNSYHQDCFVGDSKHYDAFSWENNEGETEDNVDEWIQTFQNTQRSGAKFLTGCTTGEYDQSVCQSR